MHMAESFNLAALGSETSLTIIYRVRYSLRHTKGQSGSRKYMSSISSTNQRIHILQYIAAALSQNRHAGEQNRKSFKSGYAA